MVLGKCKGIIVGMKLCKRMHLSDLNCQLFYFNLHLVSIVCKEELGLTLICKSHDGMQVKNTLALSEFPVLFTVLCSNLSLASLHEHAISPSLVPRPHPLTRKGVW